MVYQVGTVANYPNAPVTLAQPIRGIGATPMIASDNTLGSFSPYQGRLYVTYAAVNNASLTSDNTDIYLVTSDDGGVSWSAPVQVNDDSNNALGLGTPNDNFSEGNRPQFDPNVAVDQSTGTVVLDWYDVRNDAAHARVATYITASIDGGKTFSAQVFANTPRTAVDAINGFSPNPITGTLQPNTTVVLEPVPDNQTPNAGTPLNFNYGDHIGLAVSNGDITPVWAGNVNGSGVNGVLLDTLSANVVMTAGPRILSSSEGAVTPLTITTDQAGSPPPIVINDTFAPDGTPQVNGFVVTFDRPVAVSSFTTSNITIVYRSTTNQVANKGVVIPALAVTPLDGFTTRYGPHKVGAIDPATGKPFIATEFLVTFAPQSGVGTYSYSITPSIQDLIRSQLQGVAAGSPLPTTAYSTPAVGLRVPPSDTGGDAAAGPSVPTVGVAPDFGYDTRDTTFSTINVTDPAPNQQITNVTVTVNISHTFDSDLIISLIAPDGTVVPLSVREPKFDGGGDQGFIDTTFDDSASTPISAGSDPFTGTFQPEFPLNIFKGKTPNGIWTLAIDDTAQADTGTLNSWSLNISAGTVTTITTTGNQMDQNGNAVRNEAATDNGKVAGDLGDVYAVPQPTSNNPLATYGQFQFPYNPVTLPLIVPGPHIIDTFVPGIRTSGGALPATAFSAPTVNLPVPPQGTGGAGTAGPSTPTTGTAPNFGFDPRDTTFSTIAVNDPTAGDILTNLTVTVNIAHTHTSDLILDLIAPDGTIVPLAVHVPSSDPGNDQGFVNTTFADSSTSSIKTAAAPFTGTFQPAFPLSASERQEPERHLDAGHRRHRGRQHGHAQ